MNTMTTTLHPAGTPITGNRWPITIADVQAARARFSGMLPPTALRRYAPLEEAIGGGIQLFVKHENHQPTNSFKIRNGLSLMTTLDEAERRRGVVAASTGNHGQGIAYGGAMLGVDVTICVPHGNNPEKNAAMRGFGATVHEEGRDYDEAVEVMLRLAREDGRVIAHSTNDPRILAGAGTMTLEITEQAESLDALIVAVGGGSQAVGAMTVARALVPSLQVIGVGAAGAPAQHDSWHARRRLTTSRVDTFAEGVATRSTYDLTFDALVEGLSDFITVSDDEIADSLRLILSTTHQLVEGAGAMGVAAALKLRERLAGKRVAAVFCGGNLDTGVLGRVLAGRAG
jgi:threonine dehydratase